MKSPDSGDELRTSKPCLTSEDAQELYESVPKMLPTLTQNPVHFHEPSTPTMISFDVT